MHRFISLTLTGDQRSHTLIRLMAAIEILSYKHHYNIDPRGYVDVIQDNRVLTPKYDALVESVVTLNQWADFIVMYAASAALDVVFRSYYPPVLASEYLAQPYTRNVVGRKVNASASPTATLMWTQMSIPEKPSDFVANHFVPLMPNQKATEEHIDLTRTDASHSANTAAPLKPSQPEHVVPSPSPMANHEATETHADQTHMDASHSANAAAPLKPSPPPSTPPPTSRKIHFASTPAGKSQPKSDKSPRSLSPVPLPENKFSSLSDTESESSIQSSTEECN
jgi:hypothetical protein